MRLQNSRRWLIKCPATQEDVTKIVTSYPSCTNSSVDEVLALNLFTAGYNHMKILQPGSNLFGRSLLDLNNTFSFPAQ